MTQQTADRSAARRPAVRAAEPGVRPAGGVLAAEDRGRLLTRRDLERILSMSRSTIARHADTDPGFPQPARIGRELRWDPAEVEAWIAERLAERG